MITLYLVRHGETVYNLEGRIQGHDDTPLSALGLRQAQAIAERLSTESFSAIYSSDLGRARITAETIAAHHNLPVQTTPLIREGYFGVVQGLTRPEIEERFPADQHEWRRHPATMRPPGAESREEITERCGQFIQQLIDQHTDNERILVVSHGGSLRGLVVAACDLPAAFYRMMHFANAGLSILEIAETNSIRLLNDTCHLERLSGTDLDADSAAAH